VQLVGLVPWALLSLLAAQRRLMMAQDFGIREQHGSSATLPGAWASWFFCCWCALAQEGRTLEHNRVAGGRWNGPASDVDQDVEARGAPPPPAAAGGQQGGRQQEVARQQHKALQQQQVAAQKDAQQPEGWRQPGQRQSRDQYYKEQRVVVAQAARPRPAGPAPAPASDQQRAPPAGAGSPSGEALAALSMASPFATARNMPSSVNQRGPQHDSPAPQQMGRRSKAAPRKK
jgi:hypothetical protein